MGFDSLTWAGAEGEHEGRPLLITFREIPETFSRRRYPQRLNVFWQLSEADENGLPTDNEIRRIGDFEDRLVNAVEHDEHSILVGVLTCNGKREYILHTADPPGFLERLTNMPQEKDRYPIKIERYDDPDWSYFKAVMSQLD